MSQAHELCQCMQPVLKQMTTSKEYQDKPTKENSAEKHVLMCSPWSILALVWYAHGDWEGNGSDSLSMFMGVLGRP